MLHRKAMDLACRFAFRTGFPLARAWWWLRRPHHEGALVAVIVGHEILLVRSSYRRQWGLPGGSIRRREAPEAAARRELMEETGLSGLGLSPAGQAYGLWDWQRDRVYFFEARPERLPALRLDNREIVAARLVPLHEARRLHLTGPSAAYPAAAYLAGAKTAGGEQ